LPFTAGEPNAGATTWSWSDDAIGAINWCILGGRGDTGTPGGKDVGKGVGSGAAGVTRQTGCSGMHHAQAQAPARC